MLIDRPNGVVFNEFFPERSNTTPATKAMVEQSVLGLVREKEVGIIGREGKSATSGRRSSRTTSSGPGRSAGLYFEA